jgi:release factor glutamine methyltransferase
LFSPDSGVLGVSLLSELPNATCTALDILPEAVELSLLNAANILPDAATRYRGLLCSIQEFAARQEERGQYDIIVSNPPYIPSEELLTLEPEVG